MLEIERGYPC